MWLSISPDGERIAVTHWENENAKTQDGGRGRSSSSTCRSWTPLDHRVLSNKPMLGVAQVLLADGDLIGLEDNRIGTLRDGAARQGSGRSPARRADSSAPSLSRDAQTLLVMAARRGRHCSTTHRRVLGSAIRSVRTAARSAAALRPDGLEMALSMPEGVMLWDSIPSTSSRSPAGSPAGTSPRTSGARTSGSSGSRRARAASTERERRPPSGVRWAAVRRSCYRWLDGLRSSSTVTAADASSPSGRTSSSTTYRSANPGGARDAWQERSQAARRPAGLRRLRWGGGTGGAGAGESHRECGGGRSGGEANGAVVVFMSSTFHRGGMRRIPRGMRRYLMFRPWRPPVSVELTPVSAQVYAGIRRDPAQRPFD